jgi:hypothetical protein
MAGIYFATTQTYPTGVVTVSSLDATSYNALINSMGSWVYKIKTMYLKANQLVQFTNPLLFNEYDVNGTRQSFFQVMPVDPYQYQTALNFDLVMDDVVLNGRTTLSTTLNPNEIVFLVIRTEALTNRLYLQGKDTFFNDFIFGNYAEEL